MPDLWQGKPLTEANELIYVHYRIHDAETGELLGFGSNAGEGALEATVRHFEEVRAENEGRRIVLRHYDGPAHFVED